MTDLSEKAARAGHAAYEIAARANGWTSQTPVAWEDLPEANRKTTLAAYGAALAAVEGDIRRKALEEAMEACQAVCLRRDDACEFEGSEAASECVKAIANLIQETKT